MATLTADRKMLYCPKCQRKYEEGSQRFCNNDGGRLLPSVSSVEKRDSKSNGVFTNLLGRATSRSEKDEQLASHPRFVKTEEYNEPKFNTSTKSKVFKTEKQFRPKISKPITKTVTELKPIRQKEPVTEPKPIRQKEPVKTAKTLSRLIKSNEIKVGQAELGDRKTNPTGRLALTWQNPRILLGKTIKGRYFILQKLQQDLTSIPYLAQDKIRKNKKAIVRVLMQQNFKDEHQNRLFAEERVSLSHIDHPNIAKVFDSGELPEGKPFIVTEFIENESVREYLKKTGTFNPLRSARVIRQVSLALSEVHQNGILHRNLQPQHILLTISETGNEIVKVTDFCVSDGTITPDNFVYKAPEQISGHLPTYASDSYSLAVIAFQMLTNQLPFKGKSERELYKAQKYGLTVPASSLHPNINPLVDEILSKALSFKPADRYPKARDFGEAFFNALTTMSPWNATEQNEVDKKSVADALDIEPDNQKDEKPVPLAESPSDLSLETKVAKKEEFTDLTSEITSDIHIDSPESKIEVKEIDGVEFKVEETADSDQEVVSPDSLWEKRSPEPIKERGSLWTILSVLGLLILVLGVFWIWQYFNNLEDRSVEVGMQKESATEKDPTIQDADNTNKTVLPKDDIDIPPPEREIIPPKDFKFFENSKQNVSKGLAENYLGFSLFYPKSWRKFETPTNYLDVKLRDDDGFPKQQFIVTRYESKGNYELDKANFPNLVDKSNKDLKEILPNYKTVSQGKVTVNNGWKAYEVKFKGKTNFDKKSDNFEIWGRRIWIPTARPATKSGYVITMLATSLSDKINGLDDVGKTGELGDILYTFEPDRNY